MLSESDSKARLYQVILMDRTTSPKVNRFLRELTGVNIWEASTLMNTVHSVIIEEIPLHEAIEIKSKLGRLGIKAHIESMSASKADIDESDSLAKREKVVKKPPTEPPIKKTEPPASSVEPSETIPSVSEPPPAPTKPLPPGRLSSRKRGRVSIFRMALPFAAGLVIVIIIIYVIGECNGRIQFFEGGGISQYQEAGKPSHQPQFVQTEQDIIAKMQRMRESDRDGESIISEQSMSEGAIGASQGGDESAVSPETKPETSDSDFGGVPDQYTGQPAGGEGSPPGAAGAGEGSSGQPYDSPLKVPPEGVKSGPPGSSTGWLGGGQPMRSPREFVGNPIGKGISAEKLDAVTDDAREALSRNDSALAAQDFHRLKLAEVMVRPSQGDVLDRINSPQYDELLDELESVRKGYDLREGVDFYPEITGANIRIHTNLPDGALVRVEKNLPGGGKPEKCVLPVELNMIEVPREAGLPSGLIIVKVYLMPLREQPDDALNIIGYEGEALAGRYRRGKGKVEFAAQLINLIARWRGEISRDEAEDELLMIASGEGLGDYDISGFADFSSGEKPFITIEASGVEEEDFLIKACRSAGILTQDMDNPPQYLRLLVNGHQYFIPTFICRRALRENGGDDPAWIEYLANNLLSL